MIRDTTILISGRASNAGFLFLLTLAVSRILGPEGFGVFSFLTLTVTTAAGLANFGLDTWLVREVSRQPDFAKQNLARAMGLKTFTALATWALLGLVFTLTPLDSEMFSLLMLMSGSLLFNAWAQALWHYGDGFQKFTCHSVLWAMSNILKALLGIAMVFLFRTVEAVVWSWLVAEAIGLIVSWIVVHKHFGTQAPLFRASSLLTILKQSAPLAAVVVLGALYFRLNVMMLTQLSDAKEVGLFSAGFRLVEIGTLIPASALLVLFPQLVKKAQEGSEALASELKSALPKIAIAGLICALIVSIGAGFWMELIYGSDYLMGIPILRILGLSLFFYFINFLLSHALISVGGEWKQAGILLAVTAISFCFSFWLIPPFHGLGAAWTTLGAEVLLTFLLVIRLWPLLSNQPIP